MDDEYRVDITDSAAYVLEVVRNRVKKTVTQRATDEPADFWVIAALIDGIASRVAWTPKI